MLPAAASVVGLSLVGHAQSPVGVQEPAWSPDGKRIAVSYLDRLWTMTPDGKQARAIIQDLKTSSPQAPQDLVIEREPAWSPDGNRIAFAADRGEGFDIFVVTIKNGVAAGAAGRGDDDGWRRAVAVVDRRRPPGVRASRCASRRPQRRSEPAVRHLSLDAGVRIGRLAGAACR